MLKRNKKLRVSSILCAGMLVITGTIGASAAQSNSLDQDRLVGEHLGWYHTTSEEVRQSNATVDYVTGNLCLRMPSNLQQFELYYNSQDTEDSIFGPGMSSRYQQRVEVYNGTQGQTPTANDVMVYKKEDGQRAFLEPHQSESGEQYWGENGSQWDCLRLENDGYSINLGQESACTLYNADGQLTRYTIRHLAYAEDFDVQYNSPGGILATDMLGSLDGYPTNTYHLLYRDNNGPRVSQLKETGYGVDIDFMYDKGGRLVTFSSSYASIENFTLGYDGDSSKITRITSSLGNVTEVNYTNVNGLDRVSFITVKDANGTLLDQKQFAYGNGQTVIIQMDGTVTIKTY